MVEYFKSFDLVLKTTPYNLWMWLKDETKYKTSVSIEGNSIPLLKPPKIIIDLADSERWWCNEAEFLFMPSRSTRETTPLPHDDHATFMMAHEKLFHERDGQVYKESPEFKIDVIRISFNKVDDNCTQVIGDYWAKIPSLDEYMNRIRDQMQKKFPVIVSVNGESKKPAKGKVRGPNSATIKAIDKLFEYRQNVWDGGFGDMPYWTDVCKEIGISPKTAKKYAPNLHENFRDKNYKWDWFMEDIWWEENSS